jgi:hypothetical protein
MKIGMGSYRVENEAEPSELSELNSCWRPRRLLFSDSEPPEFILSSRAHESTLGFAETDISELSAGGKVPEVPEVPLPAARRPSKGPPGAAATTRQVALAGQNKSIPSYKKVKPFNCIQEGKC